MILAPALGAHLGQDELGEAHEPKYVRLELAPHGVQRDGLDRPALAVAGVVDEHADRALGLLDRIDRRRHRLLVGHVQGERLAARVAQVGDRLGSTRRGVDGPSAGRETQRGRAADTRGAARYQHGLRRLGHARSICVRERAVGPRAPSRPAPVL
jgi:hypothetical protein